MTKRKILMIVALSMAAFVSMLAIPSCGGPSGPTTGPAGDSAVTGQVKAIRKHNSGYPYDFDATVLSSQDVGSLPNPTKDKVNQTITLWSNDNLKNLDDGENFTANVKLVNDPSKPDPIFFAYNVNETP